MPSSSNEAIRFHQVLAFLFFMLAFYVILGLHDEANSDKAPIFNLNEVRAKYPSSKPVFDAWDECTSTTVDAAKSECDAAVIKKFEGSPQLEAERAIEAQAKVIARKVKFNEMLWDTTVIN